MSGNLNSLRESHSQMTAFLECQKMPRELFVHLFDSREATEAVFLTLPLVVSRMQLEAFGQNNEADCHVLDSWYEEWKLTSLWATYA